MYIRYSIEDLLFLRDSPLCLKPDGFPPAEEWMGAAPETSRSHGQNQQQQQHQQSRSANMGAFDKFRNNIDSPNSLLDQPARRPAPERHVSRNSATNPEDIVFGPPRMAFASSGRAGGKTTDAEKQPKEGEPQSRFANLRSRNGESDGDRFRESRNANPLRRRGDTNEDSDGWTPVKPRKSFGSEGAERFQNKFAAPLRDDKRTPRTLNDRTDRPFDSLTRGKEREKEADEEGRPSNGAAKNGTDPWHKSKNSETRVPEKRERIDRAKSWRERDPEADQQEERDARVPDRRWGGRAEREPEWLDEPQEPKAEARTQQDFQKWMEAMKQAKSGGATTSKPTAVPMPDPSPEVVKPPVQSAPAAEMGPDKFFMAFASTTSTEVKTPGEQADVPTRPKPVGKSSRFTSFFAQPPSDKPDMPVPSMLAAALESLPAAMPAVAPPPPSIAHAPADEERQAFQALLSKLQKQSMTSTPPAASAFAAPSHGHPNEGGNHHAAQSPLQALLGGNQREGPVGRPPPHEILAPRPQPQSARPEQLLQDLVGHHQRVSSQGSGRGDGPGSRHITNNNSNTEFLMNLMRGPGGPDRSDSAMLRAFQQAPPPNQGPPPPADDFQRDSRNAQRQMRPVPPPGFPMDEGVDFMPNPNQPTQILQRPPPPPGLDQMPPNWMGGRGQMPPPLPSPQQGQPPQQGQAQGPPHPQQRGPMIPPPGLAGRNAPLPGMPPMFAPNFPPGAMPPHPDMGPPRNMGPPPPGFFGQMPPGFMPPGMGGFNGPMPQVDAPGGGFGPTSPFEARGMMPPGGRGANFGRG